MADITIIRNGARISLANFPKLGSGSENIAVAVSASGAYDTYTTELYYGWYQGSSMQKMLAQYQNGLYYIPANALFNAGNVYLTLRLVSGGNKVSTNTIPITIERSAVNNEYSILPATETWQSAVDYYINNSNSYLNKRIDNLVANTGNSNSEIVDARVGINGVTYKTLGNAMRTQLDKLKGVIAKKYTINSNYNYELYTGNIPVGTEMIFRVEGNRANIIITDKDGTLENLFDSIEPSKYYYYKSTKEISRIGIFVLNYNNTSETFELILGKYIVDLITKKVDAPYYYTDAYTQKKDGKLYSLNGEYTFSVGCNASAVVNQANKAKITGYGWNSTYGYYLYAFYDKNGKMISHVDNNEYYADDLEIDIPDDAFEIKVNGRNDQGEKGVANIKLLTYDTNFENCVKYVEKKRKTPTYHPKLITLGDSITALGTGDRGWIKYFIEKTGCTLVANVAVNGAILSDYSDTGAYDGNPVFQTHSNVLGNQVQKIINNNYENPDIIMIAIGTNAGIKITKDQIASTYYDSNGNLINLDDVDRKTNAGAYRYVNEKLHELYPNAIIFWCSPIMGYQKTRSIQNIVSYYESLKIATDYSGQILIDTIHCGINGVNEKGGENGEYLIDGLHPNSNGAKLMGYFNAARVMPFIKNIINSHTN